MSGRSRCTLLFDLDGTLIDSSGGVVEAVNHALNGVGEPARLPEEIKPWIGYSLKVMFPHFTQAPYEILRQLFLEKADLEVAYSAIMLSGVPDTLQELHELGYQMGIVSTKRRLHIEQVIDRFNWRDYFQLWVGGDEVTHVKPSTDPFTLAMKRLGVGPDDCVIIGDTENDIHPARELGIYSVAVKSIYDITQNGWPDALLKSCPDEKIDNLTELPAIVKRLELHHATRRAV